MHCERYPYEFGDGGIEVRLDNIHITFIPGKIVRFYDEPRRLYDEPVMCMNVSRMNIIMSMSIYWARKKPRRRTYLVPACAVAVPSSCIYGKYARDELH